MTGRHTSTMLRDSPPETSASRVSWLLVVPALVGVWLLWLVAVALVR